MFENELIRKWNPFRNPFNPNKGSTIFSFEHNKAGESLDVTIDIFNITGEKVMTLQVPQSNGSARFNELEWNGLNEFGASLASGTYIFKATVKDATGATTQQSNRLVIVR